MRRGGCAVNKRREATLVPRRRGGFDQPFFYLLTSTPPSAPDKEAPRYLFDVASSPPQLRRGVCAPTGCVKYIDALKRRGTRETNDSIGKNHRRCLGKSSQYQHQQCHRRTARGGRPCHCRTRHRPYPRGHTRRRGPMDHAPVDQESGLVVLPPDGQRYHEIRRPWFLRQGSDEVLPIYRRGNEK